MVLQGLSGYFARKDEKEGARLARKRGQYSIDERMKPLLDLYFGKQLASLQGAKGHIEEGYADAENQISQIGRGAMRDAKDAGLQAGGRLASGLVSSGLHGTSVRGNLARGVQSDVTRRISEINESLAGLRSNLYTNRGHALAGAEGNIASHYGQRLGSELDLESLRYGLLTGSSGSAADANYGPGAMAYGFQGASKDLSQALGFITGMSGGGGDE